MLYNVVRTIPGNLESINVSLSVPSQMKAIDSTFPHCSLLCCHDKLVSTLAFVGEILRFEFSDKSLLTVRRYGVVCFSKFYKLKFGFSWLI